MIGVQGVTTTTTKIKSWYIASTAQMNLKYTSTGQMMLGFAQRSVLVSIKLNLEQLS
jgi:hypothetical protein